MRIKRSLSTLTIEKLKQIDFSEEWLDIFGEISKKTVNQIRLEKMKHALDTMLGRCANTGEPINTSKVLRVSQIIDKLIIKEMTTYNTKTSNRAKVRLQNIRFDI
jgi:hypothetical protein